MGRHVGQDGGCGIACCRGGGASRQGGERIAGNYFEDQFRALAQQQAFEKEIFRASLRQPAESEASIFMAKGLIVLYRTQDEATFFVVGSDDENEVILATVLDAMVDACCRLVPGRLTTPNMMRALEYLVLAMDELVDGGTILEIDSGAIVSRVSMKSTVGEVPLHEQTPQQAFSSIKEQLQRQFKLPTT